MGPRQKLNEIFKSIVPNVYFQPPEDVKLEFPCIVYKLSDIKDKKADNLSYVRHKMYEGKLITRNADTEDIIGIINLPFCSFDRYYSANNLHHFAFKIYY